MALRGATSGELSSKSYHLLIWDMEDGTSVRSLTNKSDELHATNGADALGINEVDSSISINNNSSYGGSPSDVHNHSQAKKKRLHRLTSQQSQVLESFFSMCAHPNEDQRKQLSETTGLTEPQVKFWFQNKRTHVKNLSGKEENLRLKVENEILRDENIRLKKSQRIMFCPSCTSEPGQAQIFTEMERLRVQNEWMKEELAHLAAKLPLSPPSLSGTFQLESSTENVFAMQDDAQVLAEIAKIAVHEIAILADTNGPLWLPVPGGSLETLNKVAYARTFPWQSTAGATGLKIEATRANAVVMMDPKNIVDFLMDAESYGTFFPGVMSSAATAKVYNWPADRSVGYDGAMMLLTIEVVFPSPLVPSRKCTFLRYCKQLEKGATAIVDVSLDDGDGTFFKCRRMPSGVLIQPIRHNSCKVIAIEHVRVDDTGVHELFEPCLSGLLFGARRWVMSMARQCARIRDVFHVTNSTLRVSSMGRKTMMKLADSLLANYTGGVAAIPAVDWTTQCGEGTKEDVKIVYRRNDDGGRTAVVCATASFLVPVPMRRAFDLLRNNMLRVKWDILVNGGSVKEEVRVANGVGSEDAVSILHVKHGSGAKKEIMMILQNSCYDVSGSFMVYSTLERQLMDMIMSPGGEEAMSNVTLFPSGFSLVPLPDATQDGFAIGEVGGTLITTGFQILMKLARGTGLCPRSVSSAIKILQDQIQNVTDTLVNSHPKREADLAYGGCYLRTLKGSIGYDRLRFS
ncbi:hypothetical protein ACP70R_038467 [Stipagrostis hirtigluma subsp. patula]